MNFVIKRYKQFIPIIIFLFACCLFLFVPPSPAQRVSGCCTSSLRGQVTDLFGAVIVDAKITLIEQDKIGKTGKTGKTVQTDDSGRFVFPNLAPDVYTVRFEAAGFNVSEQTGVEITPNSLRELNIQMSVALEEQKVTIDADGGGGGLNTAPDKNAGALVLRGSDLESLPENQEELNDALRSLAGAGVGPDGGQILIDGFTNFGQPLPSAGSIREIRINQNPFSAENDRVGFGQIQIITRPGTEKLQGEAFFNFNDESLNSRNPFAPSREPYQVRFIGSSLSGTIVPRRASFYAYFDRRQADDNAFVNATVLDEDLFPVPLRQTVLVPRRQMNLELRFDSQPTPSQTFGASYSFYRLHVKNAGVGGFSLPERGFDIVLPVHDFQLSETAVIKSKYINEFRLQYIGENEFDEDLNAAAGINVLGAFSSGGSGTGEARNPEGRLTVQDSLLWTAGSHTLRTGIRFRRTTIKDISPDFFNGIFTFGGGLAPRLDPAGEIVRDSGGQIISETITSIERYRRTLFLRQRGFSPADVRLRGGGATLFQRGGGNSIAFAGQFELGTYVQDDWRLNSTLSLSFGLRYDFQTNVKSGLNIAPRFSFAWTPKILNPDPQQPQTIIRGGFGVFYDRFNENQVVIANRFRKIDLFQFAAGDARILDAFPAAPSIERLREILSGGGGEDAQTTWRLAEDLRVPYMMQTAASLERRLPFKTVFSATFIAIRARHTLRARNVNAPVVVRGAANKIISSLRPDPVLGNVYQYESNGKFDQRQLVLALNNRFGPRISFYAGYTLNKASSDTDGVGTFPADGYDLSSEMGRAASDVRHSFSAGGTFILPFKIRLNPLVFASSGRPFNITTGRDFNLDSWFTDRPAFASNLSKPGVIITRFGTFDPDPVPGERIIPRNYGTTAGFFIVNVTAGRVFKFGRTKTVNGKQTEKPYSLQLGLRVINIFNRVNPGFPVGNLSSPFFGEAVSTSSGFGASSVGNPAAGNRRIELQSRFSF